MVSGVYLFMEPNNSGFPPKPLPSSTLFLKNALWLGVFPGIDAPKVDYVVDQVRALLGHAA